MATTMTGQHDIIDHLPTRLKERVRTYCKNEKISTRSFFANAIKDFFLKKQKEEEAFEEGIRKMCEESDADFAAGKLETFHTKEDGLAHLRKIREAAERRRCVR